MRQLNRGDVPKVDVAIIVGIGYGAAGMAVSAGPTVAATARAGKTSHDVREVGQFKQSIKQAELEQLLIASDNQNYTILGRTYTIIPPAGRRARRMDLFTG